MSKIFSDSKSGKLRELLIEVGITESIHPEIIQEVQNFGQDMYDSGLEDGIAVPVRWRKDADYNEGYDDGYNEGYDAGRLNAKNDEE